MTFTESRGVEATIKKIGVRFIARDGEVWIPESGEFHGERIVIPANGSNTYESWVRTEMYSDEDMRGATVVVTYSGKDAHGYTFDNTVSAKLSP